MSCSLNNQENLAKLKKFILDEIFTKINQNSQRVLEYANYVTNLKKDLLNLPLQSRTTIDAALCQFYLARLYGECKKTYYAWKKPAATKNFDLDDTTRIKCALIFYINVLIEVVYINELRPKFWKRLFSFKYKHEHNLLVKQKRQFYLQTLVEITKLLNNEPLTAAAIDSLYAKARQVLYDSVKKMHSKDFKKLWHDRAMINMLLRYNYTLFDKMGIDITKQRLKIAKQYGKLYQAQTSFQG